MLGYNDASLAVGADMFNDGGGFYVLMKNLECRGNETSIGQCKFPPMRFHDLGPEVGVICGPRNITGTQLRS